MRKRKLQIFLSSTYEDLIDHRLAAIEAILAAGHIPAAMEQFSPGDETAWEKITSWIDESDAFILILGGRYGSIEPTSGKSYVEREYEYAVSKKKPFFALVVDKDHHEQRVKHFGLSVDERAHPREYNEFKSAVKQKLCAPWSDKKDIKAAIFQKLPEWAQRTDLIGWIRADEATTPEVTNELARLSGENRELRGQLRSAESFDGLEFEDLTKLLGERRISKNELKDLPALPPDAILSESGDLSLLEYFELAFDGMAAGFFNREQPSIISLVSFGLLRKELHGHSPRFTITEAGRRLRNRLLSRRLRPSSEPSH